MHWDIADRRSGIVALVPHFILALLTAAVVLSAPASGGSGEGWRPAEILPRQSHAMAYDSQRDVTVLFGGFAHGLEASLLGDTWEYSGAAGSDWVHRDVPGPSPRSDAAMCFDQARGVTVLFGGSVGPSGLTSETWEWNGVSWTLRATGGPPPRSSADMVFDVKRGVCVLYGGSAGANAVLDDTWEWDGRGWTLRTTVGGTGGRRSHAMAYDSARDVTVLYGGATPTQFANDQTWEYDGVHWVLREAGSGGGAQGMSMAYDVVQQRVVRWGGDPFGGIAAWNGLQWDGVSISFNAPPGAFVSTRINNALVYDTARQMFVMFGGYDGNASVWGDTWEWSGSGAAVLRNPSPQGVPDRLLTVYDEAREIIATYHHGVMWEYNPVTRAWTARAATGVPERRNAAMVYDAARDRYVMFGGQIEQATGVDPPTNETWEWDPTAGTWSLRSNTGPSPRWNHALAFDSSRNVTVLFGGQDFDGSLYTGTWEWNGTTWMPRSESGPARILHDMAFDAVRNVTVLFGGQARGGSALLNDVWEWNGVTGQWAQIAASNAPPARSEHRIIYDDDNQRLLAFAGFDGGYRNDLWAYDGASHAWTQLEFDEGPAPRTLHAMTWDTDRNTLVVLGGWNQFGKLRDHWELPLLADTCIADIVPDGGGNNAVDVDDLIAVILSWGACPSPCPPRCDADIAPPGGNCAVDVDDLIAVILGWGPCP